MLDFLCSGGVISNCTRPECDTPPRPPVVASTFKITLSPLSISRYLSCNCLALVVISITKVFVTSKGVPTGIVILARTVSLGMRGKNINLVQPLIISDTIMIKTPINKLNVVSLYFSTTANNGW